MIFNGFGTDFEDQGDGFGGLALGDQLKDLALTGGEPLERGLLVGDLLERQSLEQAVGQLFGKVNLAGEDPLQSGGQFSGGGFLKQVTRGTGFKGMPEVFFVLVHGENNDPHLGEFFRDALGGFQAVEAVHGNIHEDDGRLERGEERKDFTPIIGLADELDSGNFFEFRANPRPNDRVIVGQQDSNRFFGIVPHWNLHRLCSAIAVETRRGPRCRRPGLS